MRAVIDADGNETGQFEVPAGGRRFRALELLVRTRRMAKVQPVPCVVRVAGIAEEDSLAENVMRVGVHPLDQFRAFGALIEAGLSEEDIAARFFVSASTVRQRLRLASVSPTLLDVYGEDGMTLELLMAFSVTDNHPRQEQVWEQINQGQHVSAYQIRRLLTEDSIDARDRRVLFIGLEAYVEAGGHVTCSKMRSDGYRQRRRPRRGIGRFDGDVERADRREPQCLIGGMIIATGRKRVNMCGHSAKQLLRAFSDFWALRIPVSAARDQRGRGRSEYRQSFARIG